MKTTIIPPAPLSGFPELLPEIRIVENKILDTIRKNYELAGFASIETSAVERIEVLTSKWADDREIFTVGRLSMDPNEQETKLGLRFDLTVPMARYVVQNYSKLTFPFRRYQIQKSYRWERAQAGRYREFYQADIDIIGDGKLPLSADVEILTTIDKVLQDLSIWAYKIRINNKKILEGFVRSLGEMNTEKQSSILRIIDKSMKVDEAELRNMLSEYLEEKGINEVIQFVNISKSGNTSVLKYLENMSNPRIQEWLTELKTVYEQALSLGMSPETIVLDPAIARWLGYYTGTIYETFLVGNESLGSICSGGRYENLASYFTEKKLPWVGVSIGVSRLLSKLITMEKFDTKSQTPSRVLVTKLQKENGNIYLKILGDLRKAGIPSELFLEDDVSIGKQLSYADKKWIPYAIIIGEDELNREEVQLKNMTTGEKQQIPLSEIISALTAVLSKY